MQLASSMTSQGKEVLLGTLKQIRSQLEDIESKIKEQEIIAHSARAELAQEGVRLKEQEAKKEGLEKLLNKMKQDLDLLVEEQEHKEEIMERLEEQVGFLIHYGAKRLFASSSKSVS